MDQEAMLRIRDRLQDIEDELVAADLDEFMVACGAGTSSGTSHAASRGFRRECGMSSVRPDFVSPQRNDIRHRIMVIVTQHELDRFGEIG
jgi:hypothetical protein